MDPWCRPLGEKEEEGGGSSDNDDEEEEVTRPRGVPWPNGRLPLLDKLARPASDGEKRALNDDRYVARIDMPAAARTGAPPETAPAPAPAPEPEPALSLSLRLSLRPAAAPAVAGFSEMRPDFTMLEEHESKVQRLVGRLADGQVVVPIDKDVHTVMGSTAG